MRTLRGLHQRLALLCNRHGAILDNYVLTLPVLRLCSFTSSRQRRLGRLVTMKLDTPQFHSLFTPELKHLVTLFGKYDYELRIAGGAVRDLIMDSLPSDVDFATTATPDQMKIMFEKERVRMINTKGEKHGTITARINDKVINVISLMLYEHHKHSPLREFRLLWISLGLWQVSSLYNADLHHISEIFL